jgi:hypothetical protein
MRLDLEIEGRALLPLMPQSAIMLSPEEISRHIRVERDGDRYRLRLERRGEHELGLAFLAPLMKATDDQLRTFRLPMPTALTNRVSLTIPEAALEVEAPTAVRLTREEKDGSTLARAIFGPGDDCIFVWKPRARQTKLEKTAFFAELTSVARFDAGLAELRHRVRFQIAQGELKVMRVRIPGGMTVTSVDGRDLGTWRFDPASSELEARLSRPATGEYELTVVTQIAGERLPYTAEIGWPEVVEAEHQRGSVGLATTDAVFIEIEEHPAVMNADDFVRDAAALLRSAAGIEPADVRHAYRYQRPGERLVVRVNEVRPEFRSRETSGFSVADDRLVYNGNLVVEVSKAGVFSAALGLPEGYDIDTLSGEGVSHWDEEEAEAKRLVQVHFKQKLLGAVALKLALSRAVAELPDEIEVPRVELTGAVKHTGRVIVSSERGVRLSVAARKGVSELNPVELGIRTEGVLAFRLLRPDWGLTLRTEIVETRSVADFLHVARVSEGLVRHTTYLGYRLFNAGTKVFEVEVPGDLQGRPEITGPEIAHIKEARPGLWRVELSRKWFDPENKRSYPLTLRYETRFDRTAGKVRLVPAKAMGVELQRGHVVVYATDKVELEPDAVDPSLQPADARSIRRRFSAGDLSGAAFCWSGSTADYDLSLLATRHEAASLLEAEVHGIAVTTVATERGESMNRVELRLMVGSKRYLETRLPPGAEIWSVLVDDRAVVPSKKKAAEGGREILLIPLGQAVTGEMPVEVDFVYVAPPPPDWRPAHQRYLGPRFDLPLKGIAWALYLPEGFEYEDFEGSLTVNEETVRRERYSSYDAGKYDDQILRQRREDEAKAKAWLAEGQRQARIGGQMQAKLALQNAFNRSLSQRDLNEDARVQLNKLTKQQAVVGLVGRRDRLRPMAGEAARAASPAGKLGDRFSQKQAERVESSLSKEDSENLDVIARRLIEQQEKAAGFRWPLRVSLAERGRIVRFDRSLQVKPGSEMWVSFEAEQVRPKREAPGWGYAAGLFVGILALVSVVGFAGAKWGALREALKPRERPRKASRPRARRGKAVEAEEPEEARPLDEEDLGLDDDVRPPEGWDETGED